MVGVIWYRLERYAGTDWSDALVPIHPLQWYRFADIIIGVMCRAKTGKERFAQVRSELVAQGHNQHDGQQNQQGFTPRFFI